MAQVLHKAGVARLPGSYAATGPKKSADPVVSTHHIGRNPVRVLLYSVYKQPSPSVDPQVTELVSHVWCVITSGALACPVLDRLSMT